MMTTRSVCLPGKNNWERWTWYGHTFMRCILKKWIK